MANERDLIEQGLGTQVSRRGLFRGAKFAAGAGLVVAGAGALGQLDKLFGQGRAEAQEVPPEFDKPFPNPEKLIRGNLFNGGFDIPDIRDRSKPLGWVKEDEVHSIFNYRNPRNTYRGPGSVSVDLFMTR